MVNVTDVSANLGVHLSCRFSTAVNIICGQLLLGNTEVCNRCRVLPNHTSIEVNHLHLFKGIIVSLTTINVPPTDFPFFHCRMTCSDSNVSVMTLWDRQSWVWTPFKTSHGFIIHFN